MENTYKWPRLFVPDDLSAGGSIVLSEDHTHYLTRVLRHKDGDFVRVFNGRAGEWQGSITSISKKSLTLALENCLKPQVIIKRRVHVFFAPIKKQRMEWMIEKAVELGATDLHPVITQHTEIRDMNDARVRVQIIEAAEQCERMDVPMLHAMVTLDKLLSSWPADIDMYACVERRDSQHIQTINAADKNIGFIIGPEGGFSEDEKDKLTAKATVIDLGVNILRAETAVIKVLSRVL
jgi:16S rRNA (uracil1498-N3)-methyltransferase